jgi:hypothetical protein
MQSLGIIEKKMDKENDLSKSGSHRSHDERRRARSVGRHHHHSEGIPLGEHTIAQVHPLSRNLRGGMGWMSYKEKLTKSSLLHLMVSTRRIKMQRHGC